MAEVQKPADEGGVYRALLIGNSTFPDDPHNLFELKGPFNDLSNLRSVLIDSEVGLFDPANVRVLHEKRRQEIATAMERFFLSGAPADTLLLYYTGHGKTDEYDDLFLCAYDTRTDVVGSTAIRDADVDAMMRRSSAHRFIVILDCCYSGAFKSGGLMPAKLKGSGRFLLTSSRGSEPSSDAEQHHETSAFTRHLVEGLRVAVDHNGDGYVSVNEVYEHVLENLHKETKQVPQRNFDREAVGDVALARRPKFEPVLPSPVTASVERPILAISPETIELRDVSPDEELPVEIIDVFNEGGGELDWTASTHVPWISIVQHDTYCELTLKPTSGVNRGTVRIRDAGRGGARTLRVLVEVHAQAHIVAAPAEVKPGPMLQVDPRAVDFGRVTEGEERTATITVADRGSGRVTWKYARSGGFFTARRKSDQLILRLVGGAGSHVGSVVIEGGGGQTVVDVRAEISPKQAPPPKPPEDEERFDVFLQDPGESITPVILALCKGKRVGVKEAKELIDAAPVAPVLRAASAPEATTFADSLMGAGAKVRIANVSARAEAETRPGTRYDVVFLGRRPKAGPKARVVWLVRDVTTLTQSEARELVDSAPGVVRRDLHRAEAEFIVKELERVGAKAELRPSEGTAKSRTPSLFRLASKKLRQEGEDVTPTLGYRPGPAGEVLDPSARLKLHLLALSARLAESEQVNNLAFGSLDWVDGLLAVTDRRLVFIWTKAAAEAGAGFSMQGFRFEQLTGIVAVGTVTTGKLKIDQKSGPSKMISKIYPRARKDEIINVVRLKIPVAEV
jgi:ribosomal protein L7/L12